MATMNVNLTPELDRFVRTQLEGGRYLSSSEIVGEALRLLQDREQRRETQLTELREDIRRGIESGPPEPMDFASVKQRARAIFDAECATDGH